MYSPIKEGVGLIKGPSHIRPGCVPPAARSLGLGETAFPSLLVPFGPKSRSNRLYLTDSLWCFYLMVSWQVRMLSTMEY